MKLFKTYISVLMVFGAVWFAHAQDDEVSFNASVSKSKLGINERLRIDFTMNQDGDNFTPPDFDGFRVLMGPNQSVSHQWVNGKKSFSKSYSYVLSPLKKGNFTIQQATVEIDGKVFKTLPVKVEVTAAVDDPNAPPSANDIAEEKLHLVAELSNSRPYLNEAISVVYKLYVSPDINIYDFIPVDNPTYNNFWSQEIDVKRLRAENGLYNGKQYRYVILKKVVLYPQRSGDLEIEPLTLEVKVEVPTNRRNIFGERVYTQAHVKVATKNSTLKVKPLPEAGKPENFSGAVGNFDFDVILSKSSLKAGESLTAKMVVNGEGNLKLFQLPKLTLPSSLEVYEPEFSESVRTGLGGMKGQVTESYTIVPEFKGKYPVPEVAFSYFDPETEQYKTLRSVSSVIDVFDGPIAGADPANAANAPVVKQRVAMTGDQFRFLKLKANLVPVVQKEFLGTLKFYLLYFGPLLLIPLAIIIGKKRKERELDVEGNKVRKANRLVKKYLSEAKKNLNDSNRFYEALERALHNYLKAKLKLETADLSKEKISALLKENGANEDDIVGFERLMSSCELARYTPVTADGMKVDYEKAAEVISVLDKHLK
ncbi:BatD family protein [Robertkochia sediminum]|uniref:BatD family protein n=1 Tax=Robertkochia sediminum TaxID=2785326 RepID=UPI001931FA5C|nr:BatD family protein [Robertkochia sediminum]MBL7471897.1 protein BatD [Robertkochia sediminum]